ERALLAMCIADPAEGKAYLERLTPAHLSSPVAARALEGLREDLDDPMSGLPGDDEELVAVGAALVVSSERGAPSSAAGEPSCVQLEQRRLEDLQAKARERGDDGEFVALGRERAALADRIARGE